MNPKEDIQPLQERRKTDFEETVVSNGSNQKGTRPQGPPRPHESQFLSHLNFGMDENSTIQEEYATIKEENRDMSALKKPALFKNHGKLVTVACAVAFCENVMIATVGPFFPQYAKERFGAKASIVGFIIALFPMTITFMSPLFGFVLFRFGRVRMVSFGLLVLACGTLLFGLADALWVFFLARFIQGFGSAAQNVATLALLVDYIDDNELATAMGMQESAIGVGFMLGPMIGGALYTAVGFKFVFIILACAPVAMLLSLPFMIDRKRYKRSASKIKSQQKVKVKALLTRPCVVCLFVTTAALGCMGFLEPTFATHLQLVLNVSELGIGFLFAFPSVVYTVVCLFAGPLAERIGYRVVVCLGLVQLALCYFLIGPAPWLVFFYQTRVQTWILLMLGLFILGTGFALTIVPLLPLIKISFQSLDARSQDVLASLFSSACSAGEFIGPLLGGVLVDYLPQTEEVTCKKVPSLEDDSTCTYGMQWASFLFGSLLLTLCSLVLVLIPKPKQDMVTVTPDDKLDPLLGNIQDPTQ
mmetsp:Transcript_41092/g.54092  ORF Transcript_41092/g.54092 Transcript_41092/m.54092 type:complete len:530 (-) Transcript_41092:277-1866(-)